MIFLVRNALIVLAMILSPFWLPIYGTWIWIGSRADHRGQRRSLSMLKGNQVNALK